MQEPRIPAQTGIQAYSMNRPLSDITITIYGAGDDRRYWDFDLLYGMSNDHNSFQMLFSDKDTTVAAGVGAQIRLSNFTVPVAPFDTLRLVLRPSPVSPYHATTLWEIDVNFVPEPSGFGLALGFALFGGIGYYIKNRRRMSRS